MIDDAREKYRVGWKFIGGVSKDFQESESFG